jgi:hypothetical protein
VWHWRGGRLAAAGPSGAIVCWKLDRDAAAGEDATTEHAGRLTFVAKDAGEALVIATG